MMYVAFTTADTHGQYVDTFAIEVKGVNLHGLTKDGLLVDFAHADGTMERVLARIAPYGDFRIGEPPERIAGFRIVETAYPVLTKDEYHARVGKGKFLHPGRGHFVDESEL